MARPAGVTDTSAFGGRSKFTVWVVALLSGVLFLFIGGMSFGVGTSCTNAWSCTSSNCAPCRVVSFAAIGGLGVGAAFGAFALVSPWPRRGRLVLYVVGVIAVAALSVVVAQSWTPPR